MDARKKAFAKLLADMRGTLGEAIAGIKAGKAKPGDMPVAASVDESGYPDEASEGAAEHGEGCECPECKKAGIKGMLGGE